jgi:putative holliday junction resolvase
MRWLALDVGSRRVGVAVCDAGERLATPLPPLPFAGPAKLASAVARLVTEREIDAIVVGVPTTNRGTSRGEARIAEVLTALRGLLTVAVATEDERGTTAEALARLQEAGVPAGRRRELVDGVAAQIILESHLAARRRG